MDNRELKSLKLDEVLNGDTYIIPVYQRNYDWGDVQIRQLIEDILDYSEQEDTLYYIGSLVVHPKDTRLEVLDGQQRLTTLNLLAIYLKHRLSNNLINFQKVNLQFESRSKSMDTIQKIYKTFCVDNTKYSKKDFSSLLSSFDNRSTNSSMINGFKSINRVINDIFVDDNIKKLEQFAAYLMNNVEILPVQVPKNTDVTHYFEVMNNRGEQLEKHEIVKANLLSAVQDDEQAMAIIQKVWLTCSDMSRYIQTGFSVDERTAIFGENAEGFLVKSYECLAKIIDVKKEESEQFSQDGCIDLDEALKKAISKTSISENKGKESDDEGRTERFTSVIDFPNFLMQVLRIFTKTNTDKELPALDDKKLIEAFKEIIGSNSPHNVKSFIFTLLKIRYLFDCYIVKRELTNRGEGWSLKRYKYHSNQSSYVNTFGKDEEDKGMNLTCLMLLSAFHVSYPTNSRKNWLASALFWLGSKFTEQKIDEQFGTEYLEFLEQLARTFIINRYLKSESVDYLNFMYFDTEELREVAIRISSDELSDRLEYGKVAIFIFNYLDYLLWKRNKDQNKSTFRFNSNNSIEHFSPQRSKLSQSLDEKDLHSFGNLCLISSSENSSLSNDTPEQKVKILRDRIHNKQISQPSLKLQLMMDMATNGSNWDVAAIRKHGEEMESILEIDLRVNG
ncbi:DUF262 domain-containing protein [Psychrobacter sanguinis]|uniref:DUF262 domain-containing protein n=1 Tax=Psychrobacter sanguinis TaxID=861445 RepID=UPI002A761F50|nr:DUF262 domain-containing protein [Psychrobacter sanguinis]MDY3305328.1 DUF262 domain-containing protein [Psychrobacter sanguinis]